MQGHCYYRNLGSQQAETHLDLQIQALLLAQTVCVLFHVNKLLPPLTTLNFMTVLQNSFCSRLCLLLKFVVYSNTIKIRFYISVYEAVFPHKKIYFFICFLNNSQQHLDTNLIFFIFHSPSCPKTKTEIAYFCLQHWT